MTTTKLGALPVVLPKTAAENAAKRPVASSPSSSQAELAADGRTMIAHHVAFFEMLGADGANSGIVNAKSTRAGLKKLGLGGLSVPFGGVALTAPFAIPQNKSLTTTVHMDRLGEGVRADGTDTTIFKKDGSVDAAAFKNFWRSTAGAKGYIVDADLQQLVQGKPVSALEFNLLMELAGQISSKGERVLTLEHMLAFYDGTLFQDLAKARASNTLYQPTGAVAHDGLKKIAQGLSSQALQLGGVDAGEGAKAIGAANLTIDDAASLAYQKKSKTLGSTLAGAFKALCPAGKA